MGKRAGTRISISIRGPDKLIATVAFPKWGREFALRDIPLYDLGAQPRGFPGPQTCCGNAQTVDAESVKYR